ncbi:protein of unknown function [Azospirillum baldaniorum]|uniref:Uncharacterized protein n=1 Tax=Azospirillum baldaniorum TaxID=1064539 RepID=A0A9P1JSJ8_9PROT|nr:protein of unknown function [Azospirillum baldaniorum]
MSSCSGRRGQILDGLDYGGVRAPPSGDHGKG